MTEQERKDAYKRWLQQSERLARITSEDRMESPQERKRNIARALRDYGYFCQRYLKHYCECPNAGFHNMVPAKIASYTSVTSVPITT